MVSTNRPALAGQPSAFSAAGSPSPAHTTRQATSFRPGPAAAIAASNRRLAAACAALNGPQDIVEANRQLYHKRRDVLVESFGRAGWDIPPPRASMFAWAPLPPAVAHLGSLEFSKQLLTHAGVAVAPGIDFDPVDGHTWIRFSFAGATDDVREALDRLGRWIPTL